MRLELTTFSLGKPHPNARSTAQKGRKMKLLDLFCGGGGCSVGYHRAGFQVVGVDIAPQKNYPYEFHQADALEYLAEHGHEFDVIHASPPCQGYSIMRHLPWLQGREYPLLIPAVREMLEGLGKPYVIENVVGSPLSGAALCGAALGLPVIRHRVFECHPFILFPGCPGHPVLFAGKNTMGQRGKGLGGGVMGILPGYSAAEATGINWMTNRELRQAIPPAYTEYIGRRIQESMPNRTPVLRQDIHIMKVPSAPTVT